MKKRADGYILIYVLAVIVLLCALAATVSSIALSNYQTQQASVERTRQLYRAEGQIERFVAALQAQAAALSPEEAYDSGAAALEAVHTAFQKALEEAIPPDGEGEGFFLDGGLVWEQDGEGHWDTVLSVSSVTELVAVNSELQVKLAVTVTADGGETGAYSCRVTGCKISCVSYTISGTEPEAGEVE